ncbi:helix-turn-helix domain-containing protein [Myroides injenensis]|uniref:helix-turn-helix domain-containing protein n=1 Tax=Myroides injenensis TaxID=1183151 RepID=UPI000287B15C|nr:AraC family transcriptional regulator [Myroides injenensis]
MNELHRHYKELQKSLPQKVEWASHNSYKECVGQFNFENIPIKQKFIEHPNFIISYGEWSISKPISIPIESNKPTFKLQFELEGYSSYQSNTVDVEIPQDYFNFMYVCPVNGKLHYKKNRRVLEILLDIDYFVKIIGKKLPFYTTYVNLIKENKSFVLFEKPKQMTSEINKLLLDLLHNDIVLSLKSFYIEQKVLELLLLTMNIKLAKEDSKLYSSHSLTDEDKILSIKAWIDQNFLKDINVKSICQQFYINEYKLKNNFKRHHNISIIKYIKELRFNYAYKLLETGKYSVNEVANILHYEYPQHFTIAFKKRFNITPSKIAKVN